MRSAHAGHSGLMSNDTGCARHQCGSRNTNMTCRSCASRARTRRLIRKNDRAVTHEASGDDRNARR